MSIHIHALREGDGQAWSSAYPWLWEAGMAIARLRLAGACFEQDREDLVSTALQQLIRGMVEKNEGSFNQISCWGDCLAMMRHIVRSRVFDFLRSRQRLRECAMDELPEPAPDFRAHERFRLDELLPELDRLQPDPPVPQVFRDRFLEGWSTDEIAVRRGINRNTLLTYFAKGLRTLRERLIRLEGGLA